MNKRLTPWIVLGSAALIVALPFLFRLESEVQDWRPGDPVVVIISPHNEAIRHEFGHAFSAWHKEHYGRPARVDWRVIGGTSEIMRYLEAEFLASYRAWWRREGQSWSQALAQRVLDRQPPPHPGDGATPRDLEEWDLARRAHAVFRELDDAQAFGVGIDLFYGGGTFDYTVAARSGLLVDPWSGGPPPEGLFSNPVSGVLIPEEMGGEVWRTPLFFGVALSTFGICYNFDRVAELGVAHAPRTWRDLADPRYARQVGVGDPTKSGSLAKAFEMLIQEQCHIAVREAGYSEDDVDRLEALLLTDPEAVPQAYHAAIEDGWERGLSLARLIGANARYFTDSAGRVPIDVSMGNAAAGLAIDFFGRYQAEVSRRPDGRPVMAYVTPAGGSSVSADPIALLRGSPNRETAVRFIEFVLGEEGQKLWNYRPGTPGGPRRYALRRMPIRRDFYPSDDPVADAVSRRHAEYCSDPLRDEDVDPYRLAGRFTYRSRWTGRHFAAIRVLVRVMCMDAGDELKEAWAEINRAGGPERNPEAVAMLHRMPLEPEPVTWASAPDLVRRYSAMELSREWTLFFRNSYREALQAAQGEGGP